MTLAAKAFIAFVLTVGLGFGSLVGGFAFYSHRAGSIVVHIDSANGDRVNVRIPAILAELPLALLPKTAIRHAMDEAGPDAQRELQRVLPAMHEASERLTDAPDFELLRVRDGDTVILVRKVDGTLEVSVDGPDRVEVRVPIRLVRKLAAVLEST